VGSTQDCIDVTTSGIILMMEIYFKM